MLVPRKRTSPQPQSAPAGHWDGLVVIAAANNWDEVKLADRHMAEHLAQHHAPVLYVDPPISHLTRFNAPLVAPSLKRPRLRQIAPGSPLQPWSRRSRWSRRVPHDEQIARRQLRGAVQQRGTAPRR